jgi:hypothetical protein
MVGKLKGVAAMYCKLWRRAVFVRTNWEFVGEWLPPAQPQLAKFLQILAAINLCQWNHYQSTTGLVPPGGPEFALDCMIYFSWPTDGRRLNSYAGFMWPSFLFPGSRNARRGEPLLLATLWYQRKRTGGKSGGTRSRTTGERGEGDDKNSTPHPPTPLHPSRFHCPCRSKEQTHTQKKGGDAPQLPYSAPQGHSDPKFPIRPLLVLVVADDEDGATDRATSPAGEPATPRRRPGEGGRR